jgi:DNA-binding NarL/FixJ family response regulator
MIRVLIVDDHPIVRDGLEVLLASEKGLSIHCSVASAEEAVALCEKKGPPDVVVTDVHMPGGMTGLELAARLKKTSPSARVLLLAGMPLKAEVDEARALGAAGYLPKSSKRGVLAAAIRRVVAEPGVFVEEAYVQPKTILSAREAEILKYMALGKTREEIAMILGIGFETVRTHTKNLIAKLDASNSTGAVSRAYELGLLRA